MNRVVVVDDDTPNLKLYSALVKRVLGEDPLAFENPLTALEHLPDLRPPVIVVDYTMPEMDGLTFIEQLRKQAAHAFTPVIMLTAASAFDMSDRAIAAGATIFLEKPIALREFTAQLRKFASPSHPSSIHGEVVMPTDERETLLRLFGALQAHSTELALHATQVRDLSVAIAMEMHCSLEIVEALRVAGLVYDIGMISVPEKVRLMPASLPHRWRSLVNAHVDAGATILGGGARPLMRAAEAMARYHHERFDGGGYPEGLSGEEIPLCARIIAVADTYIALVSERPHRVEYTGDRAISQIVGQSGSAFDPRVVRAFEHLKDRLEDFRKTA
ncbi:MAG TPA: HD domain-containing phosphohydrolase [Candidatus Baltobacteraceae bacterium]|nr:HD domain-containing phosphohydrolase [Candidatus Baltobacteraceae bacterium]